MNHNTSLPIKLAELQRDLQQFLHTEPPGTDLTIHIDQLHQAIGIVIQAFERQGSLTWISAYATEETESD